MVTFALRICPIPSGRVYGRPPLLLANPLASSILQNVPVSTVPFILGLVVALAISAQVLMLMECHRPIDKRLRDLGWGGDAFALLLVLMLTIGAVGAVVGSLSAPLAAVVQWVSYWQC
jgi:nitrate reductase gamma subunit